MDKFKRIFWILPGAIIIWIFFAFKGKIHSLKDILSEDNWDYNVLFTFIFYALIFGLLIIFE
jgi:hypothetical protein